ncbi:hypothetical protein Nepgr_026610 [Nepenthes gracilis]|uniref:Uncharacterized protein n=1 Tax=Nepenthes gracilis TaxID=150966 RepID=A0AAD3TA23_NEPGR|nr:hypothetical protein Nepgr_026610 [Nepenthes gracilis]
MLRTTGRTNIDGRATARAFQQPVEDRLVAAIRAKFSISRLILQNTGHQPHPHQRPCCFSNMSSRPNAYRTAQPSNPSTANQICIPDPTRIL